MSQDRDDKGHFVNGNEIGKLGGRPAQSGKLIVKDLVWEKINRIVEMLFNTPEHEVVALLKANEELSQLSVAERSYLELALKDLSVIEALLDRVIGKTIAIDNAQHRDPIIERLYTLGPGGVSKEIDEMIEARNIINIEYQEIEDAKKKS